MKVRFDDKLSIPSSRKIQATGQMVADAAIARTGVLTYAAKELGSMFADRNPDSLVRVAQLSDDLFSEETLDKFRSAPITIGHPVADVDMSNIKELGVGTLEGKPFQDGERLAASLVLSDATAIDLVNQGTQELSVRAYYELNRVDGQEDYDAVRTICTVNHVAIVERGRAGATCRISDSVEGEVEMIEVPTADIEVVEVVEVVQEEVVQEEAVEVTAESHEEAVVEAVEEIIDPSKAELEEVKVSLVELSAKYEAAVAELDATKEKVLSDEAIEALVVERVAFYKEVAKLSDMDITGKSVIEAKRLVVAALTDMKMDDRDEVYISTRYDILLEDADDISPMTKVLSSVALSDVKIEKKPYVDQATEAYKRMMTRYSNKEI